MPFLTDKETEAWLEMQTRELIVKGRRRSVTQTKLVWETLRWIVNEYEVTTVEKLIDLACQESDRLDMPFEMTFPHVLSLYDKGLRKELGID